MKRARIYVSPNFKRKLDQARIDLEFKENRKIDMINLTDNLDIMFPRDEYTNWRRNVKKKDPFAF